ncbi:hypothetical protein J7337_003661 [Fusarium musae]|uniref:Peptidase S8/S53 domain-containing protein n=1 Tax=Fusarium musae TaxID=1042133 RepID=A0A9P8ISH9_9HYPO|nr:hypothetical protein J7337_003661 [Fusarium musae]KAG9503708.1 hypothetical protein J7337_003661 [Fusarium musae]
MADILHAIAQKPQPRIVAAPSALPQAQARKGSLANIQPQQDESENNESTPGPSESFPAVVRLFTAYRKDLLKQTSKTPEYDEIDEWFRKAGSHQGSHLCNMDKTQGEDDDDEKIISFLHHCLKATDRFDQLLPLFDWAMKTYPQLYLKGVDRDKSILNFACSKCKASKEKEYLSTLMKHYPSQLSDILKKSSPKQQGKLLLEIIPFIRGRTGPEFLSFFRHGSMEFNTTQLQTETPQTKAAVTVTGTQGIESRVPATLADDVIRKRCADDYVVLNWKAAQGPSSLDTTSHCLNTKKSLEPGQVPGLQRNKDNQTPLHLAALYEKNQNANFESQLELVKSLVAWCPAALDKPDSKGRSAYFLRVETLEDCKLEQDEIAFFLKDKILHLDNRDAVPELLYGQSKSATAATVAKKPEKEIHLDLSELTTSSSREDLIRFIDGLVFENILQYVKIPQHPFRPRDPSRSSSDGAASKHDENGCGRKDFIAIFEKLKEKGVRKIIRVIVDDDDACLHQDDALENLGEFKIEDFQWRKTDMSSSVIIKAAGNARHIQLFSSGNHSVLRDWSSSEGLNRLESQLKSVHVIVRWKIESLSRTEKYARDFIKRLIVHCPQVQSIEVRLEPLKSKSHDEWTQPKFIAKTNSWLRRMQHFAGFIGNVRKLQQDGGARQVRVAILDDGIDWSFVSSIRATGRSFYADKRFDLGFQKSWFSSSTDHGTLMAALICKICPDAIIYSARLEQTISNTGSFQPTAHSAAKAIKWAVGMNVDIISMSWTIPGEDAELQNAVTAAHTAKIVMFGAASDQGVSEDIPQFMGKMNDKVICIGGARESGYSDEKSQAQGEYFFPGQASSIPGPLPPMKSNFGDQPASSVGTALASGLTAMIMLLVNMSPKYGGVSSRKSDHEAYRLQLQNPDIIRKVFDHILRSSSDSDTLDRKRTIPVDRIFKTAKLERKLQSAPSNERAKKGLELIDEVVEKLLRGLINSHQDRDEESGSDDSDATDEY